MPRNKAQQKAYNKKYREENRERLNAWHKENYAKNREKMLAKVAEHRKIQDPEIRRAAGRRYYEKNRAKVIADAAAWAKRNAARNKELRGVRRRALKEQALAVFGSCCAMCGTTDSRVLEIDHKAGGGTHERRQPGMRSGRAFHCRIIDGRADKARYQLLCGNCHILKTYYPNDARPLKILGGTQCDA